MNNINNNGDEVVECPLCMEPLEVDDLNFYPCTCGYQICRFCWHRIRTDENELCPACRKEYPENPADFTPLTQEEMIAFKSQKRQRDQQKRQKITENRKHLSNVRVVQKNLVFVVGLPPRLADADILKRHEYFGKYGKIHKVVINPSTTYAGVQGPSASAYVTYVHNNDALRAIQSVNNVMLDGRLIKTSLGTTKYCSHFMKNQPCPKGDCMYLHEMGDPEASFTKEEMHQGKHQEYEKRLHDALISASANSSVGLMALNSSNQLSDGNTGLPSSHQSSKIFDSKKLPNINSCAISTSSTTNSSCSVSSSGSNSKNSVTSTSAPQKETWPSLSVSPINLKESSINTCNNNSKSKKERTKQEKIKMDKGVKVKHKTGNNMLHNTNSVLQENQHSKHIVTNELITPVVGETSSILASSKELNKSKLERIQNEEKEVMLIEKEANLKESQTSKKSTDLHNPNIEDTTTISDKTEIDNQDLSTYSGNENILTEKDPAKSFHDKNTIDEKRKSPVNDEKLSDLILYSINDCNSDIGSVNNSCKETDSIPTIHVDKENTLHHGNNCSNLPFLTSDVSKLHLTSISNVNNNDSEDRSCLLTSNCDTKHKQAFLLQNSNQFNNVAVPHLPDLINGIDGLQKNSSSNLNDFLNGPNNFDGSCDLTNLTNVAQIHRRQIKQQTPYMQTIEGHFPNFQFGTNMSKFFDFHKNQQQQMHHQIAQNDTSDMLANGHLCDNFHTMSLLENGSKKTHFSETKSLSASQQTPISQKIPYYSSLQHHGSSTLQQNHTVDDDLGFDPFIETQKALAELIETEGEKRNENIDENINSIGTSRGSESQFYSQRQFFESMQRSRMPPPGFSQINTFGFEEPRAQNTSQILENMNISNSCTGTSIQQPHQNIRSTWNINLRSFQPQQPQQSVETHISQINANLLRNENNQKGYSNSDWTFMDPAILSFRQFSSYPPHHQMPNHLQQDSLMEVHHQQPGINSQLQLHADRNTFPNFQRTPQAHVNANVQGMLEYLKTHQFM